MGTGRSRLAAIMMVLALSPGALFTFTRLVLTSQAAAEIERGAVVSGISPAWVAALNWMLSRLAAGFGTVWRHTVHE